MSVNVFQKAFLATEVGFFSLVTEAWPTDPQLAAVGSCCLIVVLCGGILYVTNLGDSRVVLGLKEKFLPCSCQWSIIQVLRL